VESARLFDLPFVNELIDRYLNTQLLNGKYETTVINKENATCCDLVISNCAFSELPKRLQKTYIDKVLSKAERGYLTMNSGMGNDRSIGKFSLNELRTLLPEFSVIAEEPLTGDYNYIIVWGFNKDSLQDNFQIID
tara:strand:- start:12584 stop:12991 length:408 start_codon:yes stop_codon:yes gene_type:complete